LIKRKEKVQVAQKRKKIKSFDETFIKSFKEGIRINLKEPFTKKVHQQTFAKKFDQKIFSPAFF